MRARVVLEPSEDGGFNALVPALPSCTNEGDFEEEAMANIQEAIALEPEHRLSQEWVTPPRPVGLDLAEPEL